MGVNEISLKLYQMMGGGWIIK